MPARAKKQPTNSRARLLLSALGFAAVVSVGLIIGFAATGGTYAAWNSSAPVNAVTIKTGSTTIQVGATPTGTFAARLDLGQLAGNMAPGDTLAAGFTVKNTGVTPVVLGATATTTASGTASVTLAAALRVNVVALAAGATCSTSSGSGTTALSSYAPTNLASLNAAGSTSNTTKNFCLLLSLPAGASNGAQGGTVPLTLNLTGTQVRS